MVTRKNNSTHCALSNIDKEKNSTNKINSERKRLSTEEKRYFFAKGHQKHTNFQKCRFERRMTESAPTPRSTSSIEKSQIKSNEINHENALNPDMIPLHVQRVLLELHAKSRANLSRSESNLHRNNIKINK